MEASSWQTFVAGAAVPLVVWWFTQGVQLWIKTRAARRAQLAEDERDAEDEHERHLLARAEHAEAELARVREERNACRDRVRTLDDYAHQLREDYSVATGKAPRPWPPYANREGGLSYG